MIEDSIIVKNLTKKFVYKSPDSKRRATKEILAIDDVSFSVKKEEMFGIIGLNGSGKTTLLRTITGVYQPDIGKITINGELAPLLQIGVGFNKEFTPKENILTYGILLGKSKQDMSEKIEKIIKFAELEDFVNMKLKHFSAGMRARLAFSTAMEIDSDIVLVDEVLAVGDMKFKEKSRQAFIDFKKKGKSIVITSHNMSSISQICDRAMLLNHGKMIKIGNPEEVITKYKEIIGT
jgi:ABC-type polysaccharide/polyol phosphate transport system ATPase subunit